MEIQQIKHFLRPLIYINGYGNGYGYGYGYGDGDGYGYGYGNGNGDGDGNGNGDGYGNGYGYGNGNGDGDGNGNGDGDGYGLKMFNNDKVYSIDNIPTLLKSIKGDVAKGGIVNADLTTSACYVVRNNYFFAHGTTLKEAIASLKEKTDLRLPITERIKNFKQQFKDFSKKVKGNILYEWHFKLTGSCKMGRDNFCKSHNIDLSKDKFSVNEFIELTKGSYGGDIIKQLLHNN